MNRFRGHIRKQAAVAMAACLLLQALIVAWFAPTMALAAGESAAASGIHSVIICTGNGPQRLVLDGDGNPAKDSPPAGKACPICQAFGGASVTPLLAAAPSPALPAGFLALRFAGESQPLISRQTLKRGGRDPPLDT